MPTLALVRHGRPLAVPGFSELTGEPPDLDRWAALQMPDVIVLEV